MADTTTEQKIIDYLKQREGVGATISDFCNAISVQKPSLYGHLRKLKRHKILYKNKTTSPPTWNLCHQEANLPPVLSESSPGNLKEKIVNYLSQQPAPRTATEVAQSLGLLKKKAINPTLYRLEKNQLVEQDGQRGSKPLWRLSEKARSMAEELFRDSSLDSNAPGAYSPEKKPAGVHTQKDQHRQLHRSHSKPYDTTTPAQRRRNLSGQNSHAAVSHEPMKQSDSGIVADSGGQDRGGCAGEEYMTVSVSGEGREVVMCHDHSRDEPNLPQTEELAVPDKFAHSVCGEDELTPSDMQESTDQSGISNLSGKNGDDDDKSDVDDYEDDSSYDFGPNMDERFRDMMGNLEFSHMTYVEEEGEVGEEEAMFSPDDIVLLRLSFEPHQTASASHLAELLHKTEEEMLYVLGTCGDKVTALDNLWSLTDKGAAWAREKHKAYPSLFHHLVFSEESTARAHLAPSSSSPKGLPPFPQELVASDPSFGLWAQRSPLKPSPGQGRGRGKGGSGGAGGYASIPSSLQSYPPSSFVPPPPPPSVLLSTPTTVLPTDLQKPFLESFAGIRPSEQQQRVVAASARAVMSSDPLLVTQAAEERVFGEASRQVVMYADSVPAGVQACGSASQGPQRPQFAPTLSSSLQKFAEEGLTVVVPGARLVQNQTGPGQPLGSVGMTHSGLSSVDALERQMGNAGIAANSLDGQSDGSSWGIRHGDGSMGGGDLPRSHSQPQLSLDSGGGSMAGGGSEGLQSMLKITSESFAALNKNPISALMEYAQSRRLQAVIEVVSQKGPSHRPVFLMAARVGVRQFPGVTCSNKKDGRKEAADVALRTLIAEGQYTAAALTPSISVAPETMTHFDKIAALTHQTFNMLIASIPENLAGRKVIAGLVMKRSEDDVGVVISIGTGNRCITGDKLSLEGNTVNDSHAEIITRRGFMRFLYQQLEKYEPDQPHELFEAGSSGRLRVKEGISFHLYISTAPCGDGALFSPRDVESNSAELADVERREHYPTFTSNVQGLLRTKMEGGEGTIPVDTKQVTIQTWDGVVRGERLRTMSCTDKICRWNVLGLQGALLSHFVEPVYLHSLTLGFLYDHGHLSRAVCCRLAREEPPLDGDLPAGFRLNHPWLGRVTACQPLRETQKTKALSINWTVGDQKAEVLDGTLGHCYTVLEKRLFSRLAKRSLYDSFKAVAQHLGRHDLLQAPTYHHNKQGAAAFQAAKAAMVARFQQMGCGWVKKPVEEEMFS